MANYFDRYKQGECEQVWVELVERGTDVWEEPLRSDAWAVACETMRRTRSNIEVLIPRLRHLGYQFGESPEFPAESDLHFSPPPSFAREVVDELERLFGPVPLSLRAWYEVGGAVDLVGFHPDWPDSATLDPLVVDFISPLKFNIEREEMVAHIQEMFEDWQANCEEYGEEEVGPFQLEMAPDFLHKVGCSGGPPYGIELPCQAVDAIWLDWNGTTFVDYLRRCFRCGGFPGLAGRTDTAVLRTGPDGRPTLVPPSVMMPEGHLEYLVADLLPI